MGRTLVPWSQRSSHNVWHVQAERKNSGDVSGGDGLLRCEYFGLSLFLCVLGLQLRCSLRNTKFLAGRRTHDGVGCSLCRSIACNGRKHIRESQRLRSNDRSFLCASSAAVFLFASLRRRWPWWQWWIDRRLQHLATLIGIVLHFLGCSPCT